MQTNSKHSDSVCCGNSFNSYREHRVRTEWYACDLISYIWWLARSTMLGADLVSNEHGSWPEISLLWWSNTSSTVVEITQHAHKDGHAIYWFEADGVLWVGPIAAQAKEIPLPPCHTAAASVPGFSDSDTHDALVFAVTSCGRKKKCHI